LQSEEQKQVHKGTHLVVPVQNQKSDAGANVVEKFRKVSDSVWVYFEAVIIEKTIKEE